VRLFFKALSACIQRFPVKEKSAARREAGEEEAWSETKLKKHGELDFWG
jgi:hypothetical protein